ncbi:COG3650 family protein [Capilliphycus salinus ALCB114379]|uniref:COG3650 family protein n=1 Tax=Capilliphycus salinus TaxID=2768948 RepID=UPI0039A48E7C
MSTKSFLFGIILLGLGVGNLGSTLHSSYADNTPAEGFIALGTEPFWNVKVTGDEIVFSSPTIDEQKYPYSEPMTGLGRPADVVRVYPLQGNPNGFLILKQDKSCSDGMSDNVYPYSATVIRGSEVLEGCAKKR